MYCIKLITGNYPINCYLIVIRFVYQDLFTAVVGKIAKRMFEKFVKLEVLAECSKLSQSSFKFKPTTACIMK